MSGTAGRVSSLGWILVLAVALSAFAAGAEKEKEQKKASDEDFPDTWYAEAIHHGEQGVLVAHLWSKGQRFRAETVVGGHRVVNIVNGPRYYTLDVSALTGVAIERHPSALAAEKEGRRPFAQELQRLLDAGGEKIGAEELGGRRCEVYQLTNLSGRRKIWVSEEPPKLPLRVETFHRSDGRTDRTDYVQWLSGLPLSDEFFEPRSGLLLKVLTYDEYLRAARNQQVGPVPVLFSELLHGPRADDESE